MKMMKLCILAAAWAGMQAVSAAPASVLLEKGIYTEETVGDVPAAIEIYSQIVADDLASRKYVAEALFRLGRCHASQGQTAAALEELQKLVERYPEQERLVAQAESMIADLIPKPRFPELEKGRLKYPVPIALHAPGTPAGQTECILYQSDLIEVRWDVGSAVEQRAECLEIFLVSGSGDLLERTLLAEGVSADTGRCIVDLKREGITPAAYTLHLSGVNGRGEETAAGRARIRVEPIMYAQIGMDELQPDGDIRFISSQQKLNTGSTLKTRRFVNSDFVHIERMFDGDGNEVEFTEKHEGNIYRYRATLNRPVGEGEFYVLGSEGWKDGMVHKTGGNEYRYRMHHSPGMNVPVRRVEIYRLPAGAELIETTPGDLPFRLLADGRVEVLVDTVIPVGGSLRTEFRYRLDDRAARVAVEDAALRLLAAIRERDDEALRELSADRIAGWREALPEFALECRERFQQMTGGEFNLSMGTSRIQGDLAAVKCTGPEALKEAYLVLFFERTPGGWKNILLKNSPPSQSLEDHWQAMAETVREEGWEIRMVASDTPLKESLKPAPWTDGDVLRYRLLTKTGMEMGHLIWAVQSTEHDGKACWKVEQRLVVPASGTIMASHVIAEKESFTPLTGRTVHQLGTVDAAYLPGKVLLRSKGAESPREVEVPDPVYDNEQVIYLMRRLPFAEKYQVSFPIMSVLSGTPGLECRIRVMDRESMEVASEAHDCWRIRIQVYMGEMKAVEQTAWFTVDGQVPVKFVTDQMDMELAEQTAAAQESLALQDHGVVMRLPKGWFGYELPGAGKDSEIVRLLPPEMKLEGMLCKTVRQPAAINLEDIVERDVEALKGYFDKYTVREAMTAEKEINGMPCKTFVADYEGQGEARVEYRAYCVSGPRIFWFVFRMEAGRFEEEKPVLDELIESLEIYISPEDELQACVRRFLDSNWRDIQKRKDMEWGPVQDAGNGNRSIRYVFEARIWDGEPQVFSKVFTFTGDGMFVSADDEDGYPKPLEEGKSAKK